MSSDVQNVAVIAAAIVLGGGALVGYFTTKTVGFGRFNSSILVLILVLSFGLIALVSGFVSGQAYAQLLIAVAGFAGGLMVGSGKASVKLQQD